MNTNWKLVYRVGIPLAGLLALSACGGGGGTSPTPTTVSGTAAKGMVKQAKVLACRIVNGVPESEATCASGITAADGSFSITMSDGYTGPAMIKVMAAPASMMLDETTGTDISYNMTMRAMVPAVSATTTVYVTPFSEMAASAVSKTTIDATTIGQSIDAVKTLMSPLGVDMSVMPILDLKTSGSDSPMLIRQANMVKQLGRVAMAAKYSSLLKDTNGVACNASGTTSSQQMACAVAAMAGVMNGYATSDATKSANMLAALNAQSVTSISMPIIKADGTLATPMQVVDMTSAPSMLSAMQSAGMTTAAAPNSVTMMQGMH